MFLADTSALGARAVDVKVDGVEALPALVALVVGGGGGRGLELWPQLLLLLLLLERGWGEGGAGGCGDRGALDDGAGVEVGGVLV